MIMHKIYYIRNQKVMIDSDRAGLYQVETTVKRTGQKKYQKISATVYV